MGEGLERAWALWGVGEGESGAVRPGRGRGRGRGAEGGRAGCARWGRGGKWAAGGCLPACRWLQPQRLQREPGESGRRAPRLLNRCEAASALWPALLRAARAGSGQRRGHSAFSSRFYANGARRV